MKKTIQRLELHKETLAGLGPSSRETVRIRGGYSDNCLTGRASLATSCIRTDPICAGNQC